MGVVVVRAKMMPVMDEDAGRRRARRGLGLMRLLWVSCCCCCWHAVDATDANIAAHRRPSAKSSTTPRRGVQPGARGGRLRHGYGIEQPLSGGRHLHVGHLTRPERILLGSRAAVRLPPWAAGLSLRVPLCLRVPYLYCPPPPPPPPLPSPSISPPNPLIVSPLPPSSSLSPIVRGINGQRHWHSAFQQLPPRFLMTR